MADKTPVTATVRSGGLTPSDPGAAEEWLAFNVSVQRAGERKGRLSLPSRDGLERGGDDPLPPRVGSLPSSEVESVRSLEGRLTTLERSGKREVLVEGPGGRPSSEAEIAPRVRGGSEGPHCVHGPWIGLL